MVNSLVGLLKGLCPWIKHRRLLTFFKKPCSGPDQSCIFSGMRPWLMRVRPREVLPLILTIAIAIYLGEIIARPSPFKDPPHASAPSLAREEPLVDLKLLLDLQARITKMLEPNGLPYYGVSLESVETRILEPTLRNIEISVAFSHQSIWAPLSAWKTAFTKVVKALSQEDTKYGRATIKLGWVRPPGKDDFGNPTPGVRNPMYT